jgi:hypothetical protein
MQESTEPAVAKPVDGEAPCDPANTAASENQDLVAQNHVPPNFVEIFAIPKPASSDKEVPTEEVMEDATEEQTEDETEDESTSPSEQEIANVIVRCQQEQEVRKKEPLPSDIKYAEMRRAFDRGDVAKAGELAFEFSRLRHEEEKAEKQAQARAAAEQQVTGQDSIDDQEEEEFAAPKQPEPQPDQFGVKIGGNPAKMVGLEMEDWIRQDGTIKIARYVSPEDGLINQFCRSVSLPSDRNSLLEPLFESVILPSGLEQFRTTRELFDDISALLHQQVIIPSEDCSLLAYWAIATWFTEHLAFVPSVVISGPASTADVLLRTLVAVCRRPLLLGELSATILRKLPIYPIRPTLLVRESQFNRSISAMLNASNQPGYLFLSGNTFQQLYCPKCIYVGEYVKDAAAASNNLHINLSGSTLQPDHSLPTTEEITSFQNRLFSYRLLNRQKVESSTYVVPQFRPEFSAAASELGAAIVDDDELQRGVIELLDDRDTEARVDRATGVDGLVVQAVLFHCHQKDRQKFVREIAATTNRLYAEAGESLKVSNETVGHVLKRLGLYSRRLGNAGRGLLFDQATLSHVHRLSHEYDVLTVEPTCTYCHELQLTRSEEFVQVE